MSKSDGGIPFTWKPNLTPDFMTQRLVVISFIKLHKSFSGSFSLGGRDFYWGHSRTIQVIKGITHGLLIDQIKDGVYPNLKFDQRLHYPRYILPDDKSNAWRRWVWKLRPHMPSKVFPKNAIGIGRYSLELLNLSTCSSGIWDFYNKKLSEAKKVFWSIISSA